MKQELDGEAAQTINRDRVRAASRRLEKAVQIVLEGKRRPAFARAGGETHLGDDRALAEWKRRHAMRQLEPTLPAPSEMALRRHLGAAKLSRSLDVRSR